MVLILRRRQKGYMHDIEVQKRFVELRTQGWSFARIAAELQVARGTLIQWSRQFQFEIQNLRAIEMESLREKLLATREVHAQSLATQLQAVEQELARRNVADLSTTRLFQLAESLRRQILRTTGDVEFSVPLRDIPDAELNEHAQDWVP